MTLKHASRLAVLLLVLLGMFIMWNRLVDRIIFQPSPGIDLSPQAVGLLGESVFLQTEDQMRIHAFWLPSRGATRALLFLHGNAGNASHRLPNAAEFVAMGISVLLLDYRGYGLSDGSPNEAGVYADARAGLKYLMEVRGFREDRIVVFGRSLGGSVAVDLVQQRPIAGLILESTFTSLADMAYSLLPPVGFFMGGRFDPKSKISGLLAPLLIFHGDQDEIVPYRLGRQLFDAAPEPKAFETLRGAGHNDTTQVGGRPYFERIHRFLEEVAPG